MAIEVPRMKRFLEKVRIEGISVEEQIGGAETLKIESEQLFREMLTTT